MSIIETPYGSFPEEYQIDKLEDLCVKQIGIQTGPFGSQLHNSDYVSIGTPILTVEHLGENRILHEEIPKVSDQDRERLSRYSLKKGDIVFSRVGSVDRRSLVREGEEGWLFSGRCLRVRPDPEKLDSIFLSYLMGLPSFKEYIRKIAVGATMPSLNTEILSDIPICYPQLPTQHAIARILGSLDDKIELNRQMNETLEAMARAIFKSWFVDFDPVRAKGEGRDTGLPPEIAALFPDGFDEIDGREVPRGWGVGKLSDVVGINDKSINQNYPFSNIDYIEISSVLEGKLDSVISINREEAPSRAQRLVNHGDTIWSGVRPNRKSYLFIQKPKENLVVSTGFVILSPKKIPPSYLYSWVTTESFVDYLTANADGSAYPAVRADHFGDAEILLPPEKILVEFERNVAPLRAQIHHNDEQSRTLAQIRDALLPKLMSGEITIHSGVSND
ncbi:MAG: restriction endonuclease subunit S [Methanoregula sp.]